MHPLGAGLIAEARAEEAARRARETRVNAPLDPAFCAEHGEKLPCPHCQVRDLRAIVQRLLGVRSARCPAERPIDAGGAAAAASPRRRTPMQVPKPSRTARGALEKADSSCNTLLSVMKT